MGHISGGAISGIVFGTMLFVFVSVSLALWWRRVHLDHYSTAPDAWGGSWGAKAQAELQERIDKQNAAKWAAEEEAREMARTEELSRQQAWHDMEAHVRSNSDIPMETLTRDGASIPTVKSNDAAATSSRGVPQTVK